MLGDEGNDLIDLGAGNDLSWVDDGVSVDAYRLGQLGDDTISGGAGDDLVVGDDGDSLAGGSGNDMFVVYDERDDHQAVDVADYDGSQDTLELHVDETVADLANWTLFAQTDAVTGNVMLGLENNLDPVQTIPLANLQNPSNFDVSQVTLYQN